MRKYVLVLLVMAMVASVATAQYYEEKTAEKLSKKEQRRQKRAESKRVWEINKAIGMQLMEDRDFVLLADRISGKGGVPVNVSRHVNFIKIVGDNMIVQYGLNAAVGQNGVGGVTFEGKIRKIESVNDGEGKPFTTRIQFSSPYLNGLATVNINVKGDKADASLWIHGQALNFQGVYGSAKATLVAEAKNRGAFN